MIRRIFWSIFLVCTATLILTFSGMIIVLYQNFYDIQFQELDKQTDLIASMVEKTGSEYLVTLDDPSYRLNWIASDGTVLYDSSEDPAQMPNHLMREEIQMALHDHSGHSKRYSDTLATETYYSAKQLSDGSFIRISVTMTSIYGFFGKVLLPLAVLLFGAMVVSLILSNRLARSIVRPIINIDLNDPLETKTYPQLQPLLDKLADQNIRIKNQMEELQAKSREFEVVSNNMDEGLILLSAAFELLSYNDAAGRIFHIQPDWDLASVKKLPEALEESRKHGRSTFQIRQNHRDYIVEAAAITDENRNAGFVILILDITEKVEAQKRRQEFTANVTHELKTPIQTIMASTELLEAGMVRKEDQNRFLHYISKEAKRLVEMINDIIQLSRLDAGYEEVEEEIHLKVMIEDIAAHLKPACENRGITMNFSLEDIAVKGASKTYSEIFSNLIENAFKYNKEGGSIDVCLFKSGNREHDQIVFECKDTGIGIPGKYQERVFERFFRVDKSHSKAIGGTGLGLAIVSHSVSALHGTIELSSKPDLGTVVIVRIPVIESEKEDER